MFEMTVWLAERKSLLGAIVSMLLNIQEKYLKPTAHKETYIS